MGEMVETELEMGNGMQVHSSFHTDVNELEYKDLLTSTFTQADHERGIKSGKSKDSYPQCVFCAHRYRYSEEAVECHLDPTINKASTGKERNVRACAASQSTALGPRRARFLLVQGKIRVKMQRDKTALLEAADAERKRKLEYKDLLMSTFSQADHDRGVKTWGAAKEGNPQCVFCGHRYRWSVEAVECHIDPTITKASTGKERIVRACAASESTARFFSVQGEIRAKMQRDKKALLEAAETLATIEVVNA